MAAAEFTAIEPIGAPHFGIDRPGNSQSAPEVIRVVDLHKTYYLGEIDVPVLNGVSFSIRRGEMVALMGASGSGKTTLMNILGCLDRPSSGKYLLDGQEMSELSPDEPRWSEGRRSALCFRTLAS